MAKLKIVQLESFYSEFIQKIYSAFPGLASLSFQNQIFHLLESGFSGGHNVVPYLDPSRWNSHYIVVNCSWSQCRWAEEHGLPTHTPARDLLVAQLRDLNPDILYLSDIPGFDFTILDELPRRPIIVGWHATALFDNTPWAIFDLVLSGITRIRESALAKGAKAAAEFMPAAPPYRHLGKGQEQLAGLVFSGSFSSGIHNERALQFRRLSKALNCFNLDIYTPSAFPIEAMDRIVFHPAVYGSDVIQLYASYTMVLDSRGDFNLADGMGSRETSNMRVFEATRAGSLLLTERSPNLQKYFAFGDEIETYSSFEELIDKIHYYAAPDNEVIRRRIADAGLRRVRQEHLIEHRAIWLESILEQQFGLSKRAAIFPQNPAASAATLAASSATNAFLIVARDHSLLFALAQLSRVHQEYPYANLYLLCLDQGCFSKAARMNLDKDFGLSLISLDEMEKLGVSAKLLARQGDDLWPVLQAQRYLLMQQAALQRITYLASDLSFVRPIPLPQVEDAIVVGEYDFGSHMLHARESLGALAPGLLSLTRAAAQSMASWAANKAIAELHPSINIDELVSAVSAAGLTVLTTIIETPWREEAKPQSSFALLGPLAYVQNTQWQFLPFDSAPNWQAYLNRVYLPYLRDAQALYTRYPNLVSLGEQQSLSSSTRLTEYLTGHESRIRDGYRMLSDAEYKAFSTQTSGWDTPAVAAVQHQAFCALLAAYRAGQQRADMIALTQIFSRIAGRSTTVLEEGCGSGYNSELIRLAAGQEVRYTGIDIAHSMVEMGRRAYPGNHFEVMQSEHLAYDDNSFDIVLNGASLMHTIDYDKALAEARRVASRYVVLHTVTVSDSEHNVHFEKNAYGSRVPEVCFSSRELSRMLDNHQLLPVQLENSIDYDLAKAIGVPTKSVSLACFCLPPEKHTPNFYCTYFDVNYLPRGMLLIRSLLRHDPTAVIFALCLDEITARAVESISCNIRPVTLPDLLAADPEFAQAKENRTLIEWYFTATSCLVNYLLNSHPEIERLIYLDADLYFYAPPDYLIDEAKDASVQIIEHRFSQHLAGLVAFGRFNVGWIGFTSSEEGRRLVADYRAKCIEWCYDRLEGDRFGDQKYLDKWPQDFPNCCVSQILGANVAAWNIGNWQPQKLADRIYVGSNLLIFYHFQGIKRLPDGSYATKNDPIEYGSYYDLVYKPYLQELNKVAAEIQPLIANIKINDIRYHSW